MSTITIKNLTKAFGETTVLHEFSEEFKDGEFVTLLGPSGCGKTTMLRIIAGFEKPTTGEISIDGKVVSSDKVFVPPEKRELGMVFQSYAVWPHMNVFDNVAYPLKIKKFSKSEIKNKVEEVLNTVHLSQYADRIPSQLSGGQQQRVALARALVAEPKLLLLDEPLSNLDAKLRESMRYEIKEIQRRFNMTVVYVTHDQIEAMTMSDRIFVINKGVIQQSGAPMEIYRRPGNRFIADFVGKVNFIYAQAERGVIKISGSEDTLPDTGRHSGKVILAIRPENISITDAPDGISGKISKMFYLGNENDCRVSVGNTQIRVVAPASTYDTLKVGDNVRLRVGEFNVFEDDGDDDYAKILT